MENKYYTPSIEEFHVGFEFETSYLEDYDTWKKVTLEFDDFGFYTSTWEVDSNPTEFRVKYLDKEDIESLGFKFDQYRSSGFHFYLNNYELHQPYLDTKCILKEINTNQILFNGIIKNKSELIKVLKQTEIKWIKPKKD